jgi:hypothetical protein
MNAVLWYLAGFATPIVIVLVLMMFLNGVIFPLLDKYDRGHP